MGKWSKWTVSLRRSQVCSPVTPSPSSGKSSANPLNSRGAAAAATAIASCWQRVLLTLRLATCCCLPRWSRGRSTVHASSQVGGLEGVTMDQERRLCCARRNCSAPRAVKTGCTRSYLILFNFVFLLGGASVLGLGFYMHVDRQSSVYFDLLHSAPTSGLLVLFEKLPSVFVFIGGLVTVLSFLGCCGACADSACFLSVYILLICLILITEVIIVLVLTIFQHTILLKLEIALQHQIRYEYNKTGRHSNATTIETDHVTVVLDIIQHKMNCCGSVGPEDYRYSAWFNRTRPIEDVFVPPSCCIIRHQSSTVATATSGVSGTKTRPEVKSKSAPRQPVLGDDNQCQLDAILYPHNEQPALSLKTQGCQRSLVNWFSSNVIVIIGVVFFIGLLQILDLLSACSLLAWVRDRHSEYDASEAETEFG